MHQAVTVHDATSYMQNSRRPAPDLFSHAAPVASLAVVPMFVRDMPLGAVYFCPMAAPVDFGNIKDDLLVRVSGFCVKVMGWSAGLPFWL
jgi:hypothetical protein